MGSIKLVFLLVGWLAVTGSGFFLLGAYDTQPGSTGTPHVRWPLGSPIGLDPVKTTLLIFLHPRCPCSQASVDELTSILASYRDRFAIHAIFYCPERPSDEWDRAVNAFADDHAILELRRWNDPGGRLSHQFGAETSGFVQLFDPAGDLLFSGGITPSRGDRGPNLGLEALVALAEGNKIGHDRSPNFGCPIRNPQPNPRPEPRP